MYVGTHRWGATAPPTPQRKTNNTTSQPKTKNQHNTPTKNQKSKLQFPKNQKSFLKKQKMSLLSKNQKSFSKKSKSIFQKEMFEKSKLQRSVLFAQNVEFIMFLESDFRYLLTAY